MYEEEWWFTRFVWLRNAIMHGSARAQADYEHEGRFHFHIADEMLRRSIKLAVVAAGFSDALLKEPHERRMERAIAELVAQHTPPAPTDSPDEPPSR